MLNYIRALFNTRSLMNGSLKDALEVIKTSWARLLLLLFSCQGSFQLSTFMKCCAALCREELVNLIYLIRSVNNYFYPFFLLSFCFPSAFLHPAYQLDSHPDLSVKIIPSLSAGGGKLLDRSLLVNRKFRPLKISVEFCRNSLIYRSYRYNHM